MLRVLVVIGVVLLAACSSSPKGVVCAGEVATIYGQRMGATTGTIFDLVNAFSVSKDDVTVESGPLRSTDRFHYTPAAVTKEGYLAQRLSDKQFRLIDPQQNTMITYTCE
ncbi:hypothetical protein [Paramixta manurensis]